MASIEHWKDPNLLRINFREGRVDYSREVSPGVTFHYAHAGEEDVLVYAEFYEWPGRGLDRISLKQIDSSGETTVEIPESLISDAGKLTESPGPDDLAELLNRRKR